MTDKEKIIKYIKKHLEGKKEHQIRKSKIMCDPNFDLLVDPNISHQELSILINKSRESIQKWRRRNFPEDIFKKYFKVCIRYSEIELEKIKNNIEINRSYNSIKYKKRDLKLIDHTKKFFRSELRDEEIKKLSENKKIPYTRNELEEILNSDLNAKELAIQFGRTPNAIWCIRNKYKERR